MLNGDLMTGRDGRKMIISPHICSNSIVVCSCSWVSHNFVIKHYKGLGTFFLKLKKKHKKYPKSYGVPRTCKTVLGKMHTLDRAAHSQVKIHHPKKIRDQRLERTHRWFAHDGSLRVFIIGCVPIYFLHYFGRNETCSMPSSDSAQLLV